MNRRSMIIAASAGAGVFVIASGVAAKGPAASKGANDAEIARHAQTMLEEGRKTFRYDTFGSEAFWGDALQLHKAIAGEKNGGVGPGVSPKTALSVGLKVDADALPGRLKKQLAAGKVDLDDPATTIALLKLNAVVGVTAFADPDGSVKSMGIQCAFCHSTVDDSFAPGIGKRLDGWANRDLNVGAIVSLAPNLKPFTDLLGVDVETVKKVLASWGPGRYDAVLDKDGKAFRPDGKQAGTLDPARVRPGRRQPRHLDRLRIGHLLERLCRGDPDARFGDVLRRPVRQQGSISRLREERLAAEHARQAGQGRRPSWPRCTSTSSRSRRRRHRRGHTTQAAFERGKAIFNGRGSARTCHVPPLFTEPGHNLHAPSEIGIDCVPGRPLADPHVPHGAAGRTVDASEGRLLPRRALRHLARRGQSLRWALQAEPQRREQEGSGRVPEGDLSPVS